MAPRPCRSVVSARLRQKLKIARAIFGTMLSVVSSKQKAYIRAEHIPQLNIRFQTFDSYLASKNESAFMEYARLSAEEFMNLHNAIAHRLTHQTTHRCPITTMQRLCLFLRWAGHAYTFDALSKEFNCGKSTCSQVIAEVTDSINEELRDAAFPQITRADLEKSATEFQHRYDYPRCIGALDGKHVAIKIMTITEPEFRVGNKYLENVNEDFLYHFGFGIKTVDIPAIFGDTKFVCTGGSPSRFNLYASWFAKDCGIECSENLSKSDRFVIYKTGPVCWINHGMGTPSLSIMLVETLKLMHYAKAENVKFIRLGTSGGVGVEPGTVVVTSAAMNGELGDEFVQWINGKRVARPTHLDAGLCKDLLELAKEKDIPAITGKTLCTDDFYEGQMRMDGFFCEYKLEEKFEFLKTLHDKGVRNIEMESTCFSSMTYRAGVKAAIVCVALLNRMNGDQVKIDKDMYVEYEQRPYRLVTSLIRKQVGL